ncbi:FAD binding domain-containing protein [Cordyceps javanica]|uniref:FAD binding domain-containing protein n=1 Tax=Cordyceps javanica TaxID=43265 RepID=A0A545VI95_9HYPO|nr:FAD binding domain-containing protein [Cordyceps javanica]TQW01437.1 FAD binding domain protein [Cordyceps javanica]
MSKYDFKVVVVGGGPTGLALANMLEQLKIDYVVLEAYSNITPRLGTGLFLSNSLRVLDQLGCLDAFYAGADAVDDITIRLNGVTMFSPATAEHFIQRYGYEICCSHRQHLLNVLLGNLKDKSKILVEKRVHEIVETDSGVEVLTKDGEVYFGDIVIGADGVHSIVRKEMRRMAAKVSPNHPLVTEEEEGIIEYANMFGIAYIDKPFPPRLLAMEAKQDRSYLSHGNAEGRILWGLTEKLPFPIKGKNAPRYTKADIEALIEKRGQDEIFPGITLGDLYKGSSEANGMQPLQNLVFDSWHFGRMVTVGDSAHKMVTLTGQGCNMAFQDAAALMNSLTRRLDKYGGKIPKEEIEAAFCEMEAARQEHVEHSRKTSFEMQESQAMQNKMFVKVFPLVAKNMSLDAKHDVSRSVMFNTAKLEKFPLPYRPHFIPFQDELPAKRIANGLWNAGAVAAYAVLWVGAKALCTSNDAPASLLKTMFHQITGLGQNTVPALGSAIPALYTNSLLSTMAVYWTLERYRRCNRQAMLGPLMKPTGFYSMAADVVGASAVVPAYLSLSAIKSADTVATNMVGRPVRLAAIKSLVPATIISFAIAAVTFWVAASSKAGVDAASLWRLAPLLIAPVTQIIYSRTKDEQLLKNDKKGFLDIDNSDLPALKSLYGAVTGAAAAAHLGFVVLPWLNGSSLPTLDMFRNRETFVLSGSLLGGAITSIVGTRLQGYVTTWGAVRAGLLSLLALPVVGPAAVFTGVRYWKEVTTAKFCFWKPEKDSSKA